MNDSGEPVRDIQDRLLALGYSTDPDPPGTFAINTDLAVREFQRDRGLTSDGEVGPETWRYLYEAGYRLGDRLLYLKRPMLRGEDVAELQSRLSQLGFDTGKVDGIFGPDAERAVMEFQINRGLTEDGTAGPEVITELRLLVRGALRAGREAVREKEWLRSLPTSLVGARVFFDPACRSPAEGQSAWVAASAAALALQARGGLPMLARSADTALPERVRAGRANRHGAELVISFQLCRGDTEEAVYYFASERSRSEAGALLAARVAEAISSRTLGKATAILRETRAPAVVVARNELDAELGRRVVDGLEAFFTQRDT
ncbi:MAG: peptidoglycan-binding protein [Acidimicrobiia bacterium]